MFESLQVLHDTRMSHQAYAAVVGWLVAVVGTDPVTDDQVAEAIRNYSSQYPAR